MTRTGTSLARLGLTESWAEATLDELGWWVGDEPADGAEEVMWALARSPDPDLALRAVERLVARRVRPERARRGTALRPRPARQAASRCSAAPPPSATTSSPTPTVGTGWPPTRPTATTTRVARCCSRRRGRPGRPARGLAGRVGRNADRRRRPITALRVAYRDELLLLAAADLAAVGEPELPGARHGGRRRRLADLAAAALRAALAVAVAEAGDEPGRLAIIAMGKTGGRELNYVSDVDVVFVAEPADQAQTRLASRVMRIAGEACFQVDANLRPGGPPGCAGPHPRRARVVLQAVGQDLGVPGAAEGAARRG